MKQILIWSAFFVSLSGAVGGQQRLIEVSYQLDAQGIYNFYGINNGFCNYILEINFTSLENGRLNVDLPFRVMIPPGKSALFKLSKERPADAIVFKYTTQFIKGCIQAKPDTGFTYILPVATGKEVQAYVMDNGQATGQGTAEAKNGYLLRLKMNPGDTIFAARSGRVVEVEDQNGQNDAGQNSIGTENYVEINHGDCSFGHYGILKKSSAMVSPGQSVQIGTPIGLVGGDRYGRGSEIRLSVCYNALEEQQNAGSPGGKIYREYLLLKCWTKFNGKGILKNGGTYTAERPRVVMDQEKKQGAGQKPKPQKAGAR